MMRLSAGLELWDYGRGSASCRKEPPRPPAVCNNGAVLLQTETLILSASAHSPPVGMLDQPLYDENFQNITTVFRVEYVVALLPRKHKVEISVYDSDKLVHSMPMSTPRTAHPRALRLPQVRSAFRCAVC